VSFAPQANYLLICGSLHPEVYQRLCQCGKALEVMPVYVGTRFAELHELGPILVTAPDSFSLLSELCQDDHLRPSASLLYSAVPLGNVLEHMQRFVAPANAHGGVSLLGFGDPLVARYWLDSHQGEELDAVLGPIDAWHVPEYSHSWEPEPPSAWRSFVRVTPAAECREPTAFLDQNQLNALESAARWRLMERLYLMLEMDHANHLLRVDKRQLSQWLDEHLNEAQAWGLFSQRSKAIWIEYSLRWGDGFVQQSDGPYAQWLSHNPDACKLAPELRIHQMDEDCLHINQNPVLNKEVS